MNLKTAVDRVLADLQDEEQAVWTDRSEIEDYVQRGYNELCRQTNCLWDMAYAENLPYAGDHTGKFEEPFATLFHGQMAFTSNEWERDYVQPNDVGPVNHTAWWEIDYIARDFILATSELTPLLLQVERVQFNSYRIPPVTTPMMRTVHARYQYTTGITLGYIFDEDGQFTMRKIPVPAARATTYSFTGNYGLSRSFPGAEFGPTSLTVVGSRGVLKGLPGHFPMGGGRRGFPRRFYAEVANVRVELTRRGDLVSNEFEIPDYYVRYVEHYAKAEALNHEGPGQDKKMALHYRQRFDMGVARISRRVDRAQHARKGRFGEGGLPAGPPKSPRLPWPYGPSYYPGR